VVVQADAPSRMQPEDLLRLNVMSNTGKAVPMASFATTRWITGAMQAVRYNGYPAMRISGAPAPGYSTGAAMAEMERLAAQLPTGFAYEWTGQSREEKQAGAQALILYGFAILSVFLCLAALYESWSIPLAVILVVPLGVLGVLLATLLRGYANDVYFQVGLITIIGLSAKNAILIIEFAKDLQAQGKGVIEAALAAGAPALPPHRHDLDGLRPGRAAAGHRQRRRLREPARHRHRRAGRHAHRHRPGGVLRSDLLRGGARLLPGQRAPAQAVPARAGSRDPCRRHRGRPDMNPLKRLTALAAALVLAGCSQLPQYERPAAPVPGAFPYPSAQEGAPAAALAWEEYFTDARLRTLIATPCATTATCASRR
jgi:hypothetical protein